MTQSVNAAVVDTVGGPFVVRELQLDDPRENEILVALATTGICHTDIAVRDGGAPVPFPAVLGHEGAGVVEAVGANVQGFASGDRVVLSTDWCGECANCVKQRPYACMNFFAYNFVSQRTDGSTAFSENGTAIHSHYFGQSSFSPKVVVRANTAIRVDDDVPFDVLAPMACGILTGAGAVLGVQQPNPDDPVAVFGLGTVGLSAVMAARIRGCETVIAIDPVADRRKAASELGATAVIDPQETDPVEEIRRITGTGVQFSIEASGVPAVLEQAVAALGPGGSCGILGGPPPGSRLSIDVWKMISTHTSVHGITIGGTPARRLIPELVAHWRGGRLPIERLVTVFPHGEINAAVEASHDCEVIKPVLRYPTYSHE